MPAFAGLKEERCFPDFGDHVGEIPVGEKDSEFLVGFVDIGVTEEAVGEASGVPQQIADGDVAVGRYCFEARFLWRG